MKASVQILTLIIAEQTSCSSNLASILRAIIFTCMMLSVLCTIAGLLEGLDMYLFSHCLINYLDPVFIYIREGDLGLQCNIFRYMAVYSVFILIRSKVRP